MTGLATIASVVLDIMLEAGVEFGKGPFASATQQVAQIVHSHFGIEISKKTAERILAFAGASAGYAFARIEEELDLDHAGREIRLALGKGAARLRDYTDAQLGALVVAMATASQRSQRCCRHCGKPLPAGAHHARLYCNTGCRNGAAYRRRSERRRGVNRR